MIPSAEGANIQQIALNSTAQYKGLNTWNRVWGVSHTVIKIRKPPQVASRRLRHRMKQLEDLTLSLCAQRTITAAQDRQCGSLN